MTCRKIAEASCQEMVIGVKCFSELDVVVPNIEILAVHPRIFPGLLEDTAWSYQI